MIMLLFSMLSIGCIQKDPPDVIGTIIEKETDSHVYIVWGLKDSNEKSLTLNELTKLGRGAMHLFVEDKTLFDKLEKGQDVEVWLKGDILESYPSQATADNIIVIKEGIK